MRLGVAVIVVALIGACTPAGSGRGSGESDASVVEQIVLMALLARAEAAGGWGASADWW